MPKVIAIRGFRYPKKKAERNAIWAGEMTPADTTEWVRVKVGKSHTLPLDMVPSLDRRGAIKKTED